MCICEPSSFYICALINIQMFTSRSIISSAYSIESSSVKSQLISVIICHHVLIFHKITMKLKYRCNSKQWFDLIGVIFHCSNRLCCRNMCVWHICFPLYASWRTLKIKYPARCTYVVLFDVVRTFGGARL